MLSQDGDRSIADGSEHSLEPAWIDLQRLVGWIVWAVLTPLLLVGALVGAFVPSLSTGIKALLFLAWMAVAGLLAWTAQKWPAVEYRHFRYRLDTRGIDIQRGVLWRKLISVPRSRVQHTDVAQGPLERRHGLATLSIYTAGTEFARVDLPGLSHTRAVQIRDQLLPGREHAADDGT